MPRCRFAWYENGLVCDYAAHTSPEGDKQQWPAVLRAINSELFVISTTIDDRKLNGRFIPPKHAVKTAGPLILYEAPENQP